MSITKRSDKGSALTYQEMDDNFDAIAPRSSASGSVKIPAGDTSERDATAENGMFRYNESLNAFEGYQNGAWQGIGGVGSGDVNQNAFSIISVAGQNNVAADLATDTLSIIAGTNVTITTDASGDSITINSSGGGGSSFDGAYSSLTGVPTTFTPDAHNQAWSTITSTPTTLSGYGITDGATGTQGTTGLQGVEGPEGLQGDNGNQGTNGIGIGGSQGVQGVQGEVTGVVGPQGTTGSGSQGAQGTIGNTGFGSDGAQGIQGDNGTQGTVGDEGGPGDFGPQGVQGLAGSVQGDTGFQGTQGTEGPEGFGAQGFQGTQGAGVQGVQGTDGPAGFGLQGHQGIQGDLGPIGPDGAGVQGMQGFTGIQGDLGPEGPEGEGAQGIQGIEGFQGAQGVQGNDGVGATGAQGIQGTEGMQGDAGATGQQGTQGAGNQGIQGIQGLTGFGVQGSQGTSVQGDTGQDGLGSQGIQGESTQGLQGFLGDAGSQGVQGMQGPQGTQGVQGMQGYLGPQGITGTGQDGIQGAGGLQGDLGFQGTSGITGNGVQGLQGFSGEIGNNGAQGTTGSGSQGMQGVEGVGSAGMQGAAGFNGSQGAQGTTGLQGIQGTLGLQGTTGTGTTGLQGTTGTGTTGLQGIQGTLGLQGLQGLQSIQGLQGFGGLDTTSSVNFADNIKATFGTGNDLEIYHDSSDSFVKDNGAGNLRISSNGVGVYILDDTNDATMARFTVGGSNELFHADSLKLATTDKGIGVTGTVTADGLVFNGYSPTVDFDFNNSGSVDANDYVDYLQLGEGVATGVDISGVSVITTNWDAPTGSVYNDNKFRILAARGNGADALLAAYGTPNAGYGDTTIIGNVDINGVDTKLITGIGISGNSLSLVGNVKVTGVINAVAEIFNSNQDNTAGTNQNVGYNFGLTRNDGAFKSQAGRIEVGRNRDWTALDTDVDAYMSFSAYTNNVLIEHMRLMPTGNMGIRTTMPNGSLTIADGNRAQFEFYPEYTTDANLIINFDRTTDTFQKFMMSASSHEFYIGTGSSGTGATRKVAITGDGILFGGDNAAANALDDYEEGTWTPSGTNLNAQGGRYTKVGNLVTCTCRYSASGGSVSANLTGLPFASVATTSYESAGGGSVTWQNTEIAAWSVRVTSSSTVFHMYKGSVSAVLTVGKTAFLTFSYIAA